MIRHRDGEKATLARPVEEGHVVELIAARERPCFLSDPEWQRVAEESERDGQIVTNVESVFMEPTDFSPMR